MGLFLRYPVKKTVIVNTKSGQAFRGVLWRWRWRQLILKQAEMLKPGGEVINIDGEVVLPAANVDFIQVVA